MERKTKIHAENGKHDLTITREFELPVELLFRAHTDPEIFEEWMSHEYGKTKVIKLETRKHGGYLFQTTDANGNIMFQANGVIHEFIPDKKIIRTFEMANSPFEVQLEYLEFEPITDETSKLKMHVIYRTGELRDEHLKMPFEWGLNMAHDRLQNIVSKLK
jgi:uncharacterized protein YndB with AHSA1/START domain